MLMEYKCFYLRRCSSSEQKLNIPEGILKKEVKTQEQKKEDLELVECLLC